MSGPSHYATAERLLAELAATPPTNPDWYAARVAQAQAHASLALAAATARDALTGTDGDAWREVLS